MEVTLEEAKTYLRVSTGDEDSLIESLISAATKQVQDITRQSDEEFMANEEKALIRIRVAVLYTVGYLYEHREGHPATEAPRWPRLSTHRPGRRSGRR